MTTRDNFGMLAPVSVVIPCYRCRDTIERAVASVAAQTWRPAELIMVDDASDDETPRVLQALQTRYGGDWIKIILRQENGGPGAARNTGWDAATQPYVAFLDADDTWHPMKVEIQGRFMLDHSDVDFSAHRWCVQAGNTVEVPHAQGRQTRVLSARQLLWHNVISTSTVVLKRNIALRFSGRMFSEDYELWLRLLFSGRKGVFIEQTLAYLHKAPYGESGLSRNLWLMERGELGVYWQLFREGYLQWRDLSLCVPYSLLKYVRRTMVSGMRRGFR